MEVEGDLHDEEIPSTPSDPGRSSSAADLRWGRVVRGSAARPPAQHPLGVLRESAHAGLLSHWRPRDPDPGERGRLGPCGQPLVELEATHARAENASKLAVGQTT